MIINSDECCACDRQEVCDYAEKFPKILHQIYDMEELDLPNAFSINVSCKYFKEAMDDWLKSI
jgi:hypothetical protein